MSKKGLQEKVTKVADIGRHCVVQAAAGDSSIAAIIDETPPAKGDEIYLAFDQTQTRLYNDGWLATDA